MTETVGLNLGYHKPTDQQQVYHPPPIPPSFSVNNNDNGNNTSSSERMIHVNNNNNNVAIPKKPVATPGIQIKLLPAIVVHCLFCFH